MANFFVRSTDGNDADNGTTWALAKATLAAAASVAAAGDTIYVSKNHAETAAAGKFINLPGTAASPVNVLCVDDTGDPASPTTLATTATVSTTLNNNIDINGTCYCYGITFNAGSGGSGGNGLNLYNSGGLSAFERCVFKLDTGSGKVSLGTPSVSGVTQAVRWLNCDLDFKSATLGFDVTAANFEWRGGTYIGTASPNPLFQTAGLRGWAVTLSGVDFGAFSSSGSFFPAAPTFTSGNVTMRNCKLPASWSGGLVQSGMTALGIRYEMSNCDGADTNYRLWVEDYAGTIKHETVRVRQGGASDGATSLSWKMASGANSKYPHQTLRSPEILRRFPVEQNGEQVGVAKTVTVDILHDSATNLKDDEVWVEVQYLGTTGVPLGTYISDAKVALSAAADQTASTAAWINGGMTNPNKQKLSVTFTPQKAGFLIATVHLAKASYTVYVDPKLQVS